MICTVQTVSYKFKVSFKEFGSIVCTEGMHLFTQIIILYSYIVKYISSNLDERYVHFAV